MLNEALVWLSRDAQLRRLIHSVSLPQQEMAGDLYLDLIIAILAQQLSSKAANTIQRRFLDLFENGYPDPWRLAELDTQTLRSAGVSRQKARYLRNVALFALNEELFQKDWAAMGDESIIQYLTQIKGVGRWTVQMILMFTLQRPDVFPIDDLGIQQAMRALYRLEEGTGKAFREQLIRIAEHWRPYRSLACRYLWCWKDD